MRHEPPWPDDDDMMRVAIEEARTGFAEGGVPVGAALATRTELLGSGHNERIQRHDPTAHGEIACLRAAGRRSSYAGTTLYTTLSPCPMCSGAIILFQIPRVVIGERRTYAGDVDFLRSHGIEVIVQADERCVALMSEFQRLSPQVWSEDIGGR
ncbi:cytosine deaminase [Nonomuraea solani]|uniref:Cytosine deaminase n=1 Tax=Nonomuraea solani TaxID=1144553 RepID=A0A1H6EVK4_9ACTN|nr:nucleoside deaminase [Nonomuraea solani]SEH00955.1 cytosine deaminase [Nonomuraea solani]